MDGLTPEHRSSLYIHGQPVLSTRQSSLSYSKTCPEIVLRIFQWNPHRLIRKHWIIPLEHLWDDFECSIWRKEHPPLNVGKLKKRMSAWWSALTVTLQFSHCHEMKSGIKVVYSLHLIARKLIFFTFTALMLWFVIQSLWVMDSLKFQLIFVWNWC